MESFEGGAGIGLRTVTCDLSLSPPTNLIEAAANLFHLLRAADALAQGRPIAIAPIPHTGLGRAINDRLRRAAAPRRGRWVMFGRAWGMVRIDFGAGPCDLNLSPKADLIDAAANLFHLLRAADALAQGRPIAIAPIPDTGLGLAINDRLRRAAAPR